MTSTSQAAAALPPPSGAGNRALRLRLVAGAAVIVALTAALCVYSLLQSWNATVQVADTRTRNLATLIDGDVSSILDKSRIALGIVASQLERQIAAGGIDRGVLWRVVDEATALTPEVAQIGVFDAAGRQVCGTAPASRCRGLDVADRDYFRAARSGPDAATRLYGPYRSRADGEWSVILSRPLLDARGEFAGVTIAIVGLKVFKSLFASIDLGDTGAVSLRRSDSLELIVRHPGPLRMDDDASNRMVSAELLAALRQQRSEGSYRAPTAIDRIERHNSYRRLAHYPLYVIVGLGTRDFLATWRAQAAWTLAFFALVVGSTAAAVALIVASVERQRSISELYDGAPCGYHSLDANGVYRHINATELSWLGCTRGEVIGKLRPADFFTGESRAAFERLFPEFRRTGRLEGAQFDLVSRDGTMRRVMVRARTVDNPKRRDVASSSVMTDITELHAARMKLQAQASELELRVAQRTAELHALASQLELAENRERQQVSRDLHDDLGQTLSAARIRLAALCASERDDVRDAARRVAELIDHADQSTRSLAAQLAPAVLYELGLVPALEWLGDEIRRAWGLNVWVVDDGAPKPLSQAARSILYRAIRELLINAAKHAGAKSVEVDVERDDGRIVVRVSDEGVGLAPARMASGSPGARMGLTMVSERLSFIGGTVEFATPPGGGTLVTLTAPLSTLEDAVASTAASG